MSPIASPPAFAPSPTSLVLKARTIVSSILPTLEVAAAYSRRVQATIQNLGSKDQYGDNYFATALSDADPSVQTLVETTLLASFESLRFFGEEYEKSLNTKYFTSQEFGSDDELLVMLDPIDGTRCYLDKRDDYQIIFSVATASEFQAAIVVIPAKRTYYYGERGGKLVEGLFGQALDDAKHVSCNANPTNCLAGGLKTTPILKPLEETHKLVLWDTYTPTTQLLSSLAMFTGDIDAYVSTYVNLIDGAVISFLASLQGYSCSDLHGNPLPKLSTHKDMVIQVPYITAKNDSIREAILQKISHQR
jgi:myo-inositol-1(or 4)-monophosphatase